jgi:hypothetical protein
MNAWFYIIFSLLPALFCYYLFVISRNGEVIDHDLEQNLDIAFKKHLGLMDAAELAQRQNSDPPLTAIDVFVPAPLEISDSKVLNSTIEWVTQRIGNTGQASEIRFWTPSSQKAKVSKQVARMILEHLDNPGEAKSIIKLISAPDCLFICDMTLHTSPRPVGPVAFVNRRHSGVSEIFMQLSPGESSQIAAAWREWRIKGAHEKISIDVHDESIELSHIVVPESAVLESTAVSKR